MYVFGLFFLFEAGTLGMLSELVCRLKCLSNLTDSPVYTMINIAKVAELDNLIGVGGC